MTSKQKTPRIVYFAPEWKALSSGVLHSTVLAEAKFLQANGIDCLFVGSEETKEKALRAEEMILKEYGIRSKIVPCYSVKYGVLGIILAASKVLKLSQKCICEFNPTHLWTDAFTMSYLCRKFARKHQLISIYDVQGVYFAEVLMTRGPGLRYLLGKALEILEYKKADRIGCVSQKLKKEITRCSGRHDAVVIPCCYNSDLFRFDSEARNRIRKQYGFEDDQTVICYCGGLSKWQRINDIVDVCVQVAEQYDKTRFLYVTQQTEELEQILRSRGMAANLYRLQSCLPDEVPGFLSSADVGIIMREDDPVNNVASPIKVGEYLSCGLPILLTVGIGDYSELISEAGAGLILDEKQDVAGQIIDFIQNAHFADLREKAVNLAQERISWQAHLDNLKRLFQ